MSAGQIYHIASIVCYVLSALVFGLAIYLFFRYRIINAFNVLSGRKLKQDMERLSHLSGASSEEAPVEPEIKVELKKGKLRIRKYKEAESKQGDTEELYRLSQQGVGSKSDTEDMQPGGKSSGGISDTEELSHDGKIGKQGSGDTDELDVVLTDASDTELL